MVPSDQEQLDYDSYFEERGILKYPNLVSVYSLSSAEVKVFQAICSHWGFDFQLVQM